MPPIKPIKRRELNHYLRILGFSGPYAGGKHQFMKKNDITLTLPNPQESEISKSFLLKILKQACISKEEWIDL
jgi:predicted RNA binding protein YcfA (HicA-like mRNA interferase family)